MSNALRFLTAIATIFTGAVAPHETAVSHALPAPSVELIDLSTDEQAVAWRDIALFAEAGLSLPPITIHRHHDRAACNDHEGLHHKVGDRSVIDICTTYSGVWEGRVILHELTHAWAFHYLTPEHKAAFKELRGWQYWLDYNHATWEENGTEQAAEIMVWALSDHPVPVLRIDQHTCSQLRDGYVALTGLEPLHGYTEYCEGRTNVRVSRYRRSPVTRCPHASGRFVTGSENERVATSPTMATATRGGARRVSGMVRHRTNCRR